MSDVKINSLTSEEREFIEKYRQADDDKKEKIKKFIFDEFKLEDPAKKKH